MADTDTTDTDLVTAEQEAAEAERLALALERRILDGDDGVTPTELDSQRSLARYAVMRLQGVRKKLADAKEARRQADLAALKAEVDDYSTGIGAGLADLLHAWFAAEDAFTAKADEHDARIEAWRARAEQLGVTEVVGGSVTPPPADGHVALGRPGIEHLIVGSRRLSRIDPATFMARLKQHSEPKLVVETLRKIDGGEGDL